MMARNFIPIHWERTDDFFFVENKNGIETAALRNNFMINKLMNYLEVSFYQRIFHRLAFDLKNNHADTVINY